MNKRVILFSILGFCLLSLLGFAREYVFENINAQLYYLYHQSPNQGFPSGLQFLDSLSYQQLYYLKFFLTFFTALVFFGCSAVFLQWGFPHQRVILLAGILYGGVFLLSLLFFGMAKLSSDSLQWYMVSRRLAEFIQSPLAFMLLIPAFLLKARMKS